ncbi:MAG: LysR family transcriptional regulator [Bacteriovorax sp.]|nr:LysR family transcriptional regulator [Bacteriovorax sp.]
MFELRYFLGVAKYENIHKASKELGISPGSLSKAVSRLEEELKVKLFERIGRNIKLTDHGLVLKARASQIVQIESATKLEISGTEGQITVNIAGPEVLLAKFGVEFTQTVREKYSNAIFEFIACTDDEAMDKIRKREAHFAIITLDSSSEFKSKNITESSFVTVASSDHPLVKFQKIHNSVPVEKLLQFEFVSPNKPILGEVGNKQSLDGWRDDKFKRIINFRSSSLKLIEEMVTQRLTLAYLPDYLAKPYINSKQWVVLKVVGCPYSCHQKIKLITKSPIDAGWIRQLI